MTHGSAMVMCRIDAGSAPVTATFRVNPHNPAKARAVAGPGPVTASFPRFALG